MKFAVRQKLEKLGIRLKKPKPRTLILSGIFMLSLYGSLTRLPHFSGVVSYITLLLSSAVGIYYFLRSKY